MSVQVNLSHCPPTTPKNPHLIKEKQMCGKRNWDKSRENWGPSYTHECRHLRPWFQCQCSLCACAARPSGETVPTTPTHRVFAPQSLLSSQDWGAVSPAPWWHFQASRARWGAGLADTGWDSLHLSSTESSEAGSSVEGSEVLVGLDSTGGCCVGASRILWQISA